MVEHRVGGVDFPYLPCLASGQNLTLTSYDMSDLWRQGVNVDDENNLSPKTITDEVLQLVNAHNWKSEVFLCSIQSNNLRHT